MKNLYLGRKVEVTKSALAKAKEEYGTEVSSTGTVISYDGTLATVRHDWGGEVDWKPGSIRL